MDGWCFFSSCFSSSERNDDKTVFPHPGPPVIHRRFDEWFLACHWRTLGCVKIQVQVRSTRRLLLEIAVVDVDALNREAIKLASNICSLSLTALIVSSGFWKQNFNLTYISHMLGLLQVA